MRKLPKNGDVPKSLPPYRSAAPMPSAGVINTLSYVRISGADPLTLGRNPQTSVGTDSLRLSGRNARTEYSCLWWNPNGPSGRWCSATRLQTEQLGTPNFLSMLSTAELAQRPSRPPDYAAENRALIALAQVMATSPESCSAEARGYRPYPVPRALRRAQPVGGGRPEEQFPLARYRRAVGSSHKRWNTAGLRPVRHGPGPRRRDGMLPPRTRFPLLGDPSSPVLEEGLLIPFHIKGEARRHNLGRRARQESPFRRGRPARDDQPGDLRGAAYQTLLSLNVTRRIASIVESSDDAIVSKDLNGVIIKLEQRRRANLRLYCRGSHRQADHDSDSAGPARRGAGDSRTHPAR